ncbi:MAG: hypothetical protein AB7G93_11735 [Bdellovibrionales bacterium]
MDMPFIKQKIIPFPLSLTDLDKELATNFSRLVAFNHGSGAESLPLYWCWIKSDNEGEIRFCFRDELSSEEDTLFESIWSSIDQEDQQEKIDLATARPLAIENAKSAAANSVWDQLTTEQRKIVIGAPLSEADIDQLVEDFGNT